MEDSKKIVLENERTALIQFLDSDGFKTSKALTDEIIKDGIEVLTELPLDDENPLNFFAKILEARGEIRANRAFERRFRDRVAEITEELGDSKEEKE